LREDDGCLAGGYGWGDDVGHRGRDVGDVLGCDEDEVKGRDVTLGDVGNGLGDLDKLARNFRIACMPTY
jgi:hypothetical protein